MLLSSWLCCVGPRIEGRERENKTVGDLPGLLYSIASGCRYCTTFVPQQNSEVCSKVEKR